MCDKCRKVLAELPVDAIRLMTLVLISTIGSDPIPGGIDTETFRKEYDVLGFAAPFVHVRRKADNVEGTMTFRHAPRTYFDFMAADTPESVSARVH